MELNNSGINYFGNKNMNQSQAIANNKNLYQIYNMKLEVNQFSFKFKQLIAYSNFRLKIKSLLSQNINKNLYSQNNYCLIDKNWLEKWKKHVGYNEIKKAYHSYKINRYLNANDYEWIKPII